MEGEQKGGLRCLHFGSEATSHACMHEIPLSRGGNISDVPHPYSIGGLLVNLNYLVCGLGLFMVGLAVGCALGNHWIKVSFYWTQNKIRHLRDHH